MPSKQVILAVVLSILMVMSAGCASSGEESSQNPEPEGNSNGEAQAQEDPEDEETASEDEMDTVTVTVVDENGNPIENADVEFVHDDAIIFDTREKKPTDNDGVVTFETESGSNIDINVEADGYENTDASLTVSEDEEITLTLQEEPEETEETEATEDEAEAEAAEDDISTVTVMVVDENGDPIENADVEFVHDDAIIFDTRENKPTNSDGIVEFETESGSNVEVNVEADGYEATDASLTVSEDEEITLTLQEDTEGTERNTEPTEQDSADASVEEETDESEPTDEDRTDEAGDDPPPEEDRDEIDTDDTSDSSNEPTDSGQQSSWTVTVLSVTDGDSMEVRMPDGGTETIRLLGVDTPETSTEDTEPSEWEDIPDNTDGREWLADWGGQASDYADDRLGGQEIYIEVDSESDRRGTYDRLLVYAYQSESAEKSFNLRLIENGYARMYDTHFSERSTYQSAESEARNNDVGVWEYTESPSSGDSDGSQDADLVVSNIHADAAGNDHENLNEEYIELTNEGSSSVDMTGWTLSDEANHAYNFPSGFTLEPGDSVTIYTGSGSDSDSQLYWGSRSAVWNNTGDTIIVTNDNGETVIEREYSG